MVYRNQLHFVQIRDFVQFFGDVNLQFAVLQLQGGTRNLDVFVVIDREVVAITRTRT